MMAAMRMFFFVLLFAAQTRAALLVTIQAAEEVPNSGSNAPDMQFQFGPWELIATPADEGMTFSAPADLLPFYNTQLTSPGRITVVVNCCGGSSRNFVSPDLLNTGQPILNR
jgi:hypothetical protein